MTNKVSKLLLKEVSKGRLILFVLAQIIGITIITTSLLLYFDMNSTVRGGIGSDYLVVTKPVNMLGQLFSSDSGFSDTEIEKLKSQAGVKSIGEFTTGRFRTTASFGLNEGGGNIYTDLFFEAVDSTYLDVKPENWSFNPNGNEVPIIIPQNYLNLYNFGFAPSTGLPRLSKGVVESITMSITIHSPQGKQTFDGRIVAFTTRLNTILVPEEFIKWGNANYAKDTKETLPQRLIVEFDAASSSSISKYITESEYEIESDGFDFERISRMTTFLLITTIIIGAIITLLSLWLLILTLYLMVERNKEKITTLSIIGYNTRAISRPLIRLALGVTSFSFIVAYMITLVIRSIYLEILSNLLGHSGSISALITPTLIIASLCIMVLVISQVMIRRQISRYIA